MTTMSAVVISETTDNKISIWDYDPDHHPVTGYFQPTSSCPVVHAGDDMTFSIACKKSKNGSFYNIIYPTIIGRKE